VVIEYAASLAEWIEEKRLQYHLPYVPRENAIVYEEGAAC